MSRVSNKWIRCSDDIVNAEPYIAETCKWYGENFNCNNIYLYFL